MKKKKLKKMLPLVLAVAFLAGCTGKGAADNSVAKEQQTEQGSRAEEQQTEQGSRAEEQQTEQGSGAEEQQTEQGGSVKGQQTAQDQNFVQANTEEGLYVDCKGREVAVPQNVETIAALDSFSGEVMVMIGAGEEMVSCPNGVKSDQMLQEIYPGLADVAVVQSGGDINAEELLTLHPDVILIKESMYETDSVREKLEKLDIPYLVIGYSSVEEQIDLIGMIGTLAGGEAAKKAEEICTYYRDIVERVQETAASISENERKSVFHSTSEATITDGIDSLCYDWITMTGCISVSADTAGLKSSGNNYYASHEQIYVWNPDVVIAQEAAVAQEFLTSEEWAGLDAVENKQVYNIPVSATRWGSEGSMETFFGMMWLGKTVYPDAYAEFDVKQEVTDFYQNYENITIDDEKYQQILSGEGIRQAAQNGGQGQ